MNILAPRVVLTYKKSSSARWLSHLDLIRTLERAIRRAQTPVEFSQGFNPRPRLSFGPALPLGATSDAELIVLRLDNPIEPSELMERLNTQLPEGIRVTDAKSVQEGQPALQIIQGCSYIVRLVCRAEDPIAAVKNAIEDFMAQNEVIAERMDKGLFKRVNIRTSVESLELMESVSAFEMPRSQVLASAPKNEPKHKTQEIVTIRMRLSHTGKHIAKPIEVAEALSKPGREFRLISLHRELFY
ncbi:MAG: TIGR03936 family radical SAM-associated protein [Armatimonadota bacterium]|nr:TIGR03936 family radical SAM-associated protein [Armatimonadota bacterium]